MAASVFLMWKRPIRAEVTVTHSVSDNKCSRLILEEIFQWWLAEGFLLWVGSGYKWDVTVIVNHTKDI